MNKREKKRIKRVHKGKMNQIINQKFKEIEKKYPDLAKFKVADIEQEAFLVVDCRIQCVKNEINVEDLISEIVKTIVTSKDDLLLSKDRYSVVSTKSVISHIIELNFGKNNCEEIFINGKNTVYDRINNESIYLIKRNIMCELRGYNKVIKPNYIIIGFVYEYLK